MKLAEYIESCGAPDPLDAVHNDMGDLAEQYTNREHYAIWAEWMRDKGLGEADLEGWEWDRLHDGNHPISGPDRGPNDLGPVLAAMVECLPPALEAAARLNTLGHHRKALIYIAECCKKVWIDGPFEYEPTHGAQTDSDGTGREGLREIVREAWIAARDATQSRSKEACAAAEYAAEVARAAGVSIANALDGIDALGPDNGEPPAADPQDFPELYEPHLNPEYDDSEDED